MSDDLRYRGYRIVSDVRKVAEPPLWTGKAAVVQPADNNGIERVYPVFAPRCFVSEESASDYLITEAKKWVDMQLRKQLSHEVTP